MKKINDGKKVLKIFEENGYEAYMVGGAIRDYLLKLPINDVDITTSATPKEVLKLFKGIPTGIKYGTVTITFRENTYEVTTFRSEEGYYDSRHPGEIQYETSVLKDVERRDFTMNGLLMDQTGLIIDHVDGKKDIKHKYIRTINNPDDRFNEDALRMLRAFYFQSKLDFEIDSNTKASIEKNRNLILKISAERVLDEMLKILHGKYLKKTLKNMVDTKFHEVLPGLKEGILHFSKQDEMPLTDIFFSTCFTLNKVVPSYWKFSNKHRHKYQSVANLANSKINFGAKELYEYGLEFTQAANRVNYILRKDKLRVLEIAKDFNDLPINSSLDLKFRARDILTTTNRKAGAWVNNLITDMVNQVLDKKLKNDYNELKEYVIANHERF
ncbi:CCA tRNA nucleotidyltransferase [Haploplasma axanthum]|uniref:CCA-adding enzyme n=1 Tax=Haploplasma axanthum TaxID=29552 RepID=A0A449BDA1_HAPAX|nr:CCA tRNA nucleotidyltransferase [Haploplasma axanthum]VEU80402.1 CCA-adding enzyme [Haploplasma axanthum]